MRAALALVLLVALTLPAAAKGHHRHSKFDTEAMAGMLNGYSLSLVLSQEAR